MKVKSHLIVVALPSIVSIAAILLGGLDYNWDHWAPATCMPSGCFCESARPSFIRQPANTWSSLAFAFAGLWLIWRAKKDVYRGAERSNPITTQFLYGAVFGACLIVVGLGSAFYHASLTLAGQFIDVMGMYFLAGFMLTYNISRSYRVKPSLMVGAYVALVSALAFVLLRFPSVRRYVFAGMIIVVLMLEYSARRRGKSKIATSYFYSALGLLVAAFVIWILDITRLTCSPESWFQGHAVWHVLCALATLFLYSYYRSESIGVMENHTSILD
jgi:Ceramidase